MASENDDTSYIDATVVLREGMHTWPGDPEFRLERHSDIERGDRLTMSAVRMGLHSGTHLDAPSHFIGDGITIDAMPLDATTGPARVIGIDDRDSVGPEELETYDIQAGERIVLRTRNSLLWDEPDFQADYVYLTEAAAHHLVERRVRCVGIDYLSIGPKGAGTPVHRTLLGAGVWVIEGLDLRAVEPGAYEMVCTPLRIERGEASPVRVLLRPLKSGD